MQIVNKNYTIVYDPALADNDVVVPFEIEDEMEELFEKSKKGKQSIKPRLLKMIRRYPKLPVLRNYLISWHIVNGQHKEAARLNDELLQQFPGYIFAKALRVQDLIKEGKIEEAGALLENKLSIEELYPERKAFHFSEFRAFTLAVVYFLAGSYRFDEAYAHIELLKKVELEDDAVNQLQRVIMKYRLQRGAEIRYEREKTRIIAEQRTEFALPQKDVELKPLDVRFEYLYQRQWVIDEVVLKEHLLNDKEALVSEFQHILKTAIEGYTFIADNDQWNPAVLHALLIFPYLDNDAAFAPFLEFYGQPYECGDYWTMDWDIELLTIFFKQYSASRLQQIFDFLTESPGISDKKIAILSLLPVFVLQSPDSRDTLIRFIKSVLEYFAANVEDENLFDTEVIAVAIEAAVDLKATELLDMIKELFDKGWVSLRVGGDFEEVSNRMLTRDGAIRAEFFDDVFAHINHIHSEARENEERRKAEYEERFNRDISQTAKKHISSNTNKGYANVAKNAPCPCGSGKKYKRCHGK